MKHILLIITPQRQSTEALHWSLHRARESKATLRVVYVIDEESTQKIQNSLAEIGFIADKPGQELSEALNKEYRERAKKVLEEAEKQARTFKIPVESEIKSGRYLDVCESLASKEDVCLLVVSEKKGSFFKKLLEGSEVKKLRERVSCEIRAYSA